MYDFKHCSGRFSFNSSFLSACRRPIRACSRTHLLVWKQYALWMVRIPAVAGWEKIICDLGLAASQLREIGGDVQAGSLSKAVELLRTSQKDSWTPADIVGGLAKIIEQEENHDSIPLGLTSRCLRIMNLHKVKGLEAPVCFSRGPKRQNEPCSESAHRSVRSTVSGLHDNRRQSVRASSTVLAQPEQWDALAEKEEQFKSAENLRLLYVAATRAGCGLTISQRESFQNQNPWAYFDSKLKGCALRQILVGPQLALSRPTVS